MKFFKTPRKERDIVFKGNLPKEKTPNEKYNDAINTILKSLKENKIDPETYDGLSKCVIEIHESYGGRISIDSGRLITKGSPEYLETLLNEIRYRSNHVSEELMETLIKIANQIKEQEQTGGTRDDNQLDR